MTPSSLHQLPNGAIASLPGRAKWIFSECAGRNTKHAQKVSQYLIALSTHPLFACWIFNARPWKIQAWRSGVVSNHGEKSVSVGEHLLGDPPKSTPQWMTSFPLKYRLLSTGGARAPAGSWGWVGVQVGGWYLLASNVWNVKQKGNEKMFYHHRQGWKIRNPCSGGGVSNFHHCLPPTALGGNAIMYLALVKPLISHNIGGICLNICSSGEFFFSYHPWTNRPPKREVDKAT